MHELDNLYKALIAIFWKINCFIALFLCILATIRTKCVKHRRILLQKNAIEKNLQTNIDTNYGVNYE